MSAGASPHPQNGEIAFFMCAGILSISHHRKIINSARIGFIKELTYYIPSEIPSKIIPIMTIAIMTY